MATTITIKENTKARILRNDIAHGKIIKISDKQTLDAINAVREFINQIELLLPDIHNTKIEIPKHQT